MVKKLLLLITLLVPINTYALMPAKEANRKTVQSILKDIKEDIQTEIYRRNFELRYIIEDLPNDALNKVTNELLDNGYSVTLDFLEPEYTDVRITINWDKYREKKRK